MLEKNAVIEMMETDFGDYYNVLLKDQNGKTISSQVIKDINEAKKLKENWENGKYKLLTERGTDTRQD